MLPPTLGSASTREEGWITDLDSVTTGAFTSKEAAQNAETASTSIRINFDQMETQSETPMSPAVSRGSAAAIMKRDVSSGLRLLPAGVDTRLSSLLPRTRLRKQGSSNHLGSGHSSPVGRVRRFPGAVINTASELPAATARLAEHGISQALELPEATARWAGTGLLKVAESVSRHRDRTISPGPSFNPSPESSGQCGHVAPPVPFVATVEGLEAELMTANKSLRTGSESGLARDRGDFRQRIRILITAEPRPESLVRGLYTRFQGDTQNLESSVFPLLEEKWGFPHQAFNSLWKHVRKAQCRGVGSTGSLGNHPNAGAARDVRRMEQFIEEDEWVEAFFRWLHGLHNRFAQIKVSRQAVVKEQTGKSYSEMYFQGSLLGEGAYGEVFLTLHKGLGTERVAKVVPQVKMGSSQANIEDEVKVLKSLDHPHIIRIYETYHTLDKMYIIMDFAEGGDLASVVKEHAAHESVLPERWARTAAEQIAAALQYMHSKGVIHCDLKPANVMLLRELESLEQDPHLLLVDFGLSEMFEDTQLAGPVNVRGTPAYLAPEGFDGKLTMMTDMWALGVIIYELLKGKRPFSGPASNLFALWMQIAKTEPSWDGLPQLPLEVVKSLLSKEPSNRLTAAEVHSSTWFKEHRTNAEPAMVVESSQNGAARAPPVLGHLNYFNRTVMFWLAAGFSMKDMSPLYALFKTLDVEHVGRLSEADLREGIQKLGLKQDLPELMYLLDLDQDGYVSYTEFLAGALTLEPGGTSDRLIRHIFDIIDSNGDGLITPDELRDFLLEDKNSNSTILPDGQTVEQVMIEVGGPGSISFEQFSNYMRKVSRAFVNEDGLLEEPVSSHTKPISRRQMSRQLSAQSGRLGSSLSSGTGGLGSIQNSDASSEGKDAPSQKFPRFHAWLDDLPEEIEDHALVKGLLVFKDYKLEALFLARSLPRKCIKASFLSILLIIGSALALFKEEMMWSPEMPSCPGDEEQSDTTRSLWWLLFCSCAVVFLLCANVGGLFLCLLKKLTKSEAPWLMAGSFLEVFIAFWGCLLVWIFCCLFMEDRETRGRECPGPVEPATLAFALVCVLSFFSLLSHMRFVCSTILATNLLVAYLTVVCLSVAHGPDVMYRREWFWPSLLLLISTWLVLLARYELEHQQRSAFASLHASYAALKTFHEEYGAPDFNLVGSPGGPVVGKLNNQSVQASICLVKNLRRNTQAMGTGPMKGMLEWLASALAEAKNDVQLLEQCMGRDPEEIVEEEVREMPMRRALTAMLGKTSSDGSSEFTSEVSHLRDDTSWGWDTLGLLNGPRRPILVAAEAVLIPAAREEDELGCGAEVRHMLGDLLSLYDRRRPTTEARAALSLLSCHWLAHRTGLWSVLKQHERLALLLASATLHCADVGDNIGSAADLHLTEPLLKRVSCAGKLIKVLQRSHNGPTNQQKEHFQWMACHLLLNSRPKQAVEAVRRVKLRYEQGRAALDCDEDRPHDEKLRASIMFQERMKIAELVIFAADFAFLALPLHMHKPWAALCQRESGRLSTSVDLESTLDVALLLKGLIKVFGLPIFETLQQCATGSGNEALTRPLDCLKGNGRYWESESAGRDLVKQADELAREAAGSVEIAV